MEPYIIGSLNYPGPIKTVVQPANYAPSRHASCGSASLQRQETGSLAHRVLSNSAPPVLFCFLPPLPPLTIVFISLEYVFSLGFWLFFLRLLLLGFGSFSWLFILSCFGPCDYALLCSYLLQRTSHWFSSPHFRTWAANLTCLRFLLLFHQLGIASLSQLQ